MKNRTLSKSWLISFIDINLGVIWKLGAVAWPWQPCKSAEHQPQRTRDMGPAAAEWDRRDRVRVDGWKWPPGSCRSDARFPSARLLSDDVWQYDSAGGKSAKWWSQKRWVLQWRRKRFRRLGRPLERQYRMKCLTLWYIGWFQKGFSVTFYASIASETFIFFYCNTQFLYNHSNRISIFVSTTSLITSLRMDFLILVNVNIIMERMECVWPNVLR